MVEFNADRFLAGYFKEHEVCSACGSDRVGHAITKKGMYKFSDERKFKIEEKAGCFICHWKGIFHDLVPAMEVEA